MTLLFTKNSEENDMGKNYSSEQKMKLTGNSVTIYSSLVEKIEKLHIGFTKKQDSLL